MKKLYKANDIKDCGIVIMRLYKQMYPQGLTIEEIESEAAQHGWMKKVYDLVVKANGV